MSAPTIMTTAYVLHPWIAQPDGSAIAYAQDGTVYRSEARRALRWNGAAWEVLADDVAHQYKAAEVCGRAERARVR